MSNRGGPLALAISISLLSACAHGGRNVTSLHLPLPAKWATRYESEGLEKLIVFKQNDVLYRSGQPEPKHFKTLKEMGLKAVINVRRTHSDEAIVETLGMKYHSILIPAWDADEEHIVEFLKIATDPDNQPLLVYCWYGGDRSNMLTAAHRVAVEGWSKDEAIREMTEGGNYYHFMWKNLADDIREMDVERVRRLAGIDLSHSLIRHAAE